MGLSLRKRSGKIFAGSRLIVEGQDILTAKVFIYLLLYLIF